MPGADRLFSLSLSFLADKRKMISSASQCCYDKKLGVDWKNNTVLCEKGPSTSTSGDSAS